MKNYEIDYTAWTMEELIEALEYCETYAQYADIENEIERRQEGGYTIYGGGLW